MLLHLLTLSLFGLTVFSLDPSSPLNQAGTHIHSTTRTLCLASDSGDGVPGAAMPCKSAFLNAPLPGVEEDESGNMYRVVRKSSVTLSSGQSISAEELHLHPGQVWVQMAHADGSSSFAQHALAEDAAPVFSTHLPASNMQNSNTLRGRRLGDEDATQKYWRFTEEVIENGRSVSRYSLDAEEVIREQGDENIKQFTGYVNAGIIPNRYEFFEDAETGAPLRMEAINTQMQAAGSGPLEITTFDSVTSGALLGEAADSVDDALKFILHNDPPVSGSSSLPLRLMGTADHSDIPKVDAVAGPWAESLRVLSFYASDPELKLSRSQESYWTNIKKGLQAARGLLKSDPSLPNKLVEFPEGCTGSNSTLQNAPLCVSLRAQADAVLPGTQEHMTEFELYLRLVDQVDNHKKDFLDGVMGANHEGRLVYVSGSAEGCGTAAQVGFLGQGLYIDVCLGGQLSYGKGTGVDEHITIGVSTGLKVAGVGVGIGLSETLGIEVTDQGAFKDLYSQTTVGVGAGIVHGSVGMRWTLGPANPKPGFGSDWDIAAFFQASFGVNLWLWKHTWAGDWQVMHAGPLSF